MPVRIVFRGLMLFHFPQTGPDAGKLVAWLINQRAAKGGGGGPGGPHDHRAEIQIVTGRSSNELIPTVLQPDVNVDIQIEGGEPIRRSASFNEHVATLETIIAKGTPPVQAAAKGPPNRELVQNVVTVDRGLVRVKDVMAWDEGAYPLKGGPGTGNRASAPVLVNFTGSETQGHMASEVIVEVDQATSVRLTTGKAPAALESGVTKPAHRHVPPNAVEILVTNYEPPSGKPTPWGLDFQWLFEAAGYSSADLSGDRFRAWENLRSYDERLFDTERALFLGAPPSAVGRPFPYVQSVASITSLTPLASPRNPPVCPFAITTTPL